MDRTPNLILVGFMGAGKSTVGQAAAELLDMDFVDSDAMIEARAQKSIPEIFADEGEDGFRRWEQRTLTELSAEEGMVIATGGGAFMNDEIRRRLMDCGLTVYLKSPFPTLWQRIGHAKGRPLLAGEAARERAESLFASREPVYEQAHVSVDGARPVDRVVAAVVEVYREHIKNR